MSEQQNNKRMLRQLNVKKTRLQKDVRTLKKLNV